MNRVENILKDKSVVEVGKGLVFVHPDSPAGQKAFDESGTSPIRKQEVLALYNGKLYGSVERAAGKWRGRLSEMITTPLCPSLEKCLDSIYQTYREESCKYKYDIDKLIEERWGRPGVCLTDEIMDRMLAEDGLYWDEGAMERLLAEAESEINKDRITLAKVKDSYGIDVHPDGEHGPPHGHFYRIKNGERGLDIASFYLKTGRPKNSKEVKGYSPQYLDIDPLGPKSKQIIVVLASEKVDGASGGNTKWDSTVERWNKRHTKGYAYIWVLNGGGNFPCGVFDSKEGAEVAIEKYDLNGTLTKYPINALVYDWAIEENIPDERVSIPLKQVTANIVGHFTTAYQEHYHYFNDDSEVCNNNKMEMISMKWIIEKHFQYGMTMNGTLFSRDYGGKAHGLVEYIINPDCVVFYSTYGFDITGHKMVKQRVRLDWLSRKYGSKRVYFLCPSCGRRVAILYSSAVAFVCKICDKPLSYYGYGLDWENVQKDLWEYA